LSNRRIIRSMAEITLRVEDLVTFTDAAKILGVVRATVYNLVARHKLHPVIIGNNRYILRNELEILKGVTGRKEF